MYCICGQCLLPSEKQKRMTKEKFDALSIPYDVIRMGKSRGAKHGKTQEHRDVFKANESLRHTNNIGFSSFLESFQIEDSYRNSQTAIGWTEEKCIYLDSLLLENQSYTATRKERLRYENGWMLSVNGHGPVLGQMNQRSDCPQAVTRIRNLCQQAEHPRNSPFFRLIEFDKAPLVNNTKQNGSKEDGTHGQVLLPGFFIIFCFRQIGKGCNSGGLLNGKTIDDFFHCKEFLLLTRHGDSLLSDGGCKHHTHFARLRTRKCVRARGSRSDKTHVFGLQHFQCASLSKEFPNRSHACHVSHTA